MSTLGIKFVLPYTGSNGITVEDNVISIDQNAAITVRKILFLPQSNDVAIQVNQSSDGTSNAIFVVDKDDLNNLFINGSGNVSLSDNIDSSLVGNVVNLNNSNVILNNFDNMGNLDFQTELGNSYITIVNYVMGFSTNINSELVVTSKIQTIDKNPNAPLISFDSIDGTLTVPNGTVNATFDGTLTKIGSQQ